MMRSLATRWRLLILRRRLQRVHRSMKDPARLTYTEFERVTELLGFSPDRVLQVEGEAAKLLSAECTREQVQEFLDITHPKHKVDVRQMEMKDVNYLAGALIANFCFASAVSLSRQAVTATR